MNRENIRKLIKLLRSPEVQAHFYMGAWYSIEGVPVRHYDMEVVPAEFLTRCGTAACIAGWAYTLARPGEVTDAPLKNVVADWLGLKGMQALNLFAPSGPAIFLENPEKAALVLENFLETGRIDWSVAVPDEEDYA